MGTSNIDLPRQGEFNFPIFRNIRSARVGKVWRPWGQPIHDPQLSLAKRNMPCSVKCGCVKAFSTAQVRGKPDSRPNGLWELE